MLNMYGVPFPAIRSESGESDGMEARRNEDVYAVETFMSREAPALAQQPLSFLR